MSCSAIFLVSVVISTRSFAVDRALADLLQHVVDLRAWPAASPPCRVDQASGAHELLHDVARVRPARKSAGVAETKMHLTHLGFSNSSNFSGRLSSADGSRKP